ncbi:hypothetical protein SAMN04488168_101421 [Bacillus sp. 491mf]|uniref:hypothetical protein n=1 Tax=Bacillus TaxID=1386 RepID=UPI00068AE164|nr:hypothetical protein SAMN04488168_101421 [Bacillus sp. 491mf]
MMKKVLLTTIGCTFVVSITAGFIGFNKGDTGGSPQRPDLAYTHGEGWSPNYSHADLPISADGNHRGSPSYSEHGDTPSPADNKGDGGGIISNKVVSDPGVGGGMVSNEAEGDTPAPQA